MLLRILVMLGLTVLGSGPQPQPQVTKPPFGVCEVLQNLEKYRGKVIEVRGNWVFDLMPPTDCPRLLTGDHTWMNGIAMETVEKVNILGARLPEEYRPNWTFDADSWDRATSAKVRLEQQMGPNRAVFATVIGRLDVRMEMAGPELGVPKPVPFGFGHLGQYPARLVIISIRDIRLETVS